MEPRLECQIRKAFADAWALGSDPVKATEWAVDVVLECFPNMSLPEALDAIRLVRER